MQARMSCAVSTTLDLTQDELLIGLKNRVELVTQPLALPSRLDDPCGLNRFRSEDFPPYP